MRRREAEAIVRRTLACECGITAKMLQDTQVIMFRDKRDGRPRYFTLDQLIDRQVEIQAGHKPTFRGAKRRPPAGAHVAYRKDEAAMAMQP